jgi:D-cysteine desulfhydrase
MNSRFPLGFYPTPIQKLTNLSHQFIDYQLYIKRDDQTGLATGGNKTRKLEYLIQDAIQRNSDVVLTAGAQQSNHCRQTAAACAKANLECHLLLGGFEPKTYNGNLLLSELLGAKIHFTGNNRKGEDLIRLENELKSKGNKPYVIPYGGSNLIGSLGYVNAVKELKHQLESENIDIDGVIFASSSGGTQAGITIGKLLYNLNFELFPISIDKEDLKNNKIQHEIFKIVNEGIEKLKINKSVSLNDCKLIKGFNEAGYGVLTKNEKEAITLLAKTEGILLDPVYTGRAFYAMLSLLKKERFLKGSKLLFWHTGGIAANFNYANELHLN